MCIFRCSFSDSFFFLHVRLRPFSDGKQRSIISWFIFSIIRLHVRKHLHGWLHVSSSVFLKLINCDCTLFGCKPWCFERLCGLVIFFIYLFIWLLWRHSDLKQHLKQSWLSATACNNFKRYKALKRILRQQQTCANVQGRFLFQAKRWEQIIL